MATAAEPLVGRHDFAAFAGALERPGASTVRRVYRCEVVRCDGLVVVEMEADAFLPHQVRRTVGLLTEIGLGRQPPAAVRECLAQPQQRPVAQTAPACGLYLVQVTYAEVDFGQGAATTGCR